MTSKKLVCTQCGYVGDPNKAVGGSGCVEVLLWFFFIIPGLIYSVWRLSSKHKICPKCGSKTLIPIDSPRAKTIISESMSEEEFNDFQKKEKEENSKPQYIKWKEWARKNIFLVIIMIIGIVGIISLIANTN